VKAFAVLLIVHGLIHLLGFAKAFNVVQLSQLSQPISLKFGVLWLITAILFMATAISLFAWPRIWWAIGAAALVLSIVVIVPSWTDAKFGFVANGVVLVAVVLGFLEQGPLSLRAEYERDVEVHLAHLKHAEPITEADLEDLPAPVQRYLRIAGVIGKPRVRNFRAKMHGRIRGAPTDRWIAIRSEQYNFLDDAARFFYFTGSMLTVPVQGYHRYVASAATMRVKAAAVVPVVSAVGPHLTQSETVTIFNDLCLLAPAALIVPAITWEAVDARSVRATFTNAGHTIHAELTFDESGELTNFVSDDRFQLGADGKSLRQVRWSTPMRAHRSFGGVRLASAGEGRWHDASGEYAYVQLVIDDVEYNVLPG
jgi:uncharacterized protein DUF6544